MSGRLFFLVFHSFLSLFSFLSDRIHTDLYARKWVWREPRITKDRDRSSTVDKKMMRAKEKRARHDTHSHQCLFHLRLIYVDRISLSSPPGLYFALSFDFQGNLGRFGLFRIFCRTHSEAYLFISCFATCPWLGMQRTMRSSHIVTTTPDFVNLCRSLSYLLTHHISRPYPCIQFRYDRRYCRDRWPMLRIPGQIQALPYSLHWSSSLLAFSHFLPLFA